MRKMVCLLALVGVLATATAFADGSYSRMTVVTNGAGTQVTIGTTDVYSVATDGTITYQQQVQNVDSNAYVASGDPVSALSNNVGYLTTESDPVALPVAQSAVTTNASQDTSIANNAAGVASNVTSAADALAAAVAVSGRVDTAEGDIDDLESRTNTWNAALQAGDPGTSTNLSDYNNDAGFITSAEAGTPVDGRAATNNIVMNGYDVTGAGTLAGDTVTAGSTNLHTLAQQGVDDAAAAQAVADAATTTNASQDTSIANNAAGVASNVTAAANNAAGVASNVTAAANAQAVADAATTTNASQDTAIANNAAGVASNVTASADALAAAIAVSSRVDTVEGNYVKNDDANIYSGGAGNTQDFSNVSAKFAPGQILIGDDAIYGVSTPTNTPTDGDFLRINGVGGADTNHYYSSETDPVAIPAVVAVSSRVDTAEGDIDDLEGRTNDWNQAVDDASQATNTATYNSNRLDTAEGDIDDLESRTNDWNQAAIDADDSTNRLTDVESRTNDWNQAATDADDATNRLTEIEGRTNDWNKAVTDGEAATNTATANSGRLDDLESRTNDWNGAVSDADDATNRVTVLEGQTNSYAYRGEDNEFTASNNFDGPLTLDQYPTNDSDVATKEYVDNNIGAAVYYYTQDTDTSSQGRTSTGFGDYLTLHVTTTVTRTYLVSWTAELGSDGSSKWVEYRFYEDFANITLAQGENQHNGDDGSTMAYLSFGSHFVTNVVAPYTNQWAIQYASGVSGQDVQARRGTIYMQVLE